MPKQMIKPWKVTNIRNEYECPVWKVTRKNAVSPDGGLQGDFFVTEIRPWVNIIATDEQGRVILVEQYRHGIEQVTLEIPAGVVDADDASARQAAERELKEETGCTGNRWTHLGRISANPAIMNNWCDIFLAEDCRRVARQNLDEAEDLAVHTVSRQHFFDYIADGTIHHSIAVASAAKWMLHLQKGKTDEW